VPVSAIELRPAEPRDDAAVARLMYATAPGRYDLFAGDRARALRLLESAIAAPGNDTSRDGVIVAVIGGEVAGALAAFPAAEGIARRRRLIVRALRRRAPWHWWRLWRIAQMGEDGPEAPRDSLYIDALATDERFRRRGVARALLDAAAERARSVGLATLALDTTAANTGARALYESAGFRLTGELPAGPVIPAVVFYERDA
jgi:ribosomal protein S18 acetylase RimI-like enzyme